jgi:peptidoglycan-associated lipoprotein
MNTISLAQRSSTLVLSIAPMLFVAACAADKPPAANAPTSMAVAAPPAPPAPSSRTEPTGGTIAITDEIRKACGIPDQDAFFAFDSAALASSDIRPLDLVARCFSSGALKGRAMRLIGHADPRGPSEYNMTLGQRRADSVEGYLDLRGVDRVRVVSTSRGAMDATGHDEAGWARDRRVDVTLVG